MISTQMAPTIERATRPASANRAAPRFDLHEVAGSLGDLGTFLPLALAMALSSGMNLGVIFIMAGVMNILTGIYFGQPIPVQPMKAIAAVAITQHLSAGAIASSGLCLSAILLLLVAIGAIDWVSRAVSKPIVRGIQAGVGLKLAWSGLLTLSGMPMVGYDSMLVAIIVGFLIVISWRFRWPSLVFIFIAGFYLVRLGHPAAYANWSLVWPKFHLIIPTGSELWRGTIYAGIPQIPLTLLNSVVAVCALSEDYFPGRGIAPQRMGLSIGLMNLLCVPLGGMPMCHGAGGLAAQHYFGARTGGSVIILGTLKILAGLLLAGILLTTLQAYPRAILAAMIIFAGLTLAAASRDCLRPPRLFVVIATALPMFFWNPLVGVACGIAAVAVRRGLTPARKSNPD